MSTDAGRQHEMVLALEAVINSLHDSQRGFADLGDHLKDDALKRHFLAESLQRASFRGDLEETLHQNGVHDINENGTATGAVYRVWGELKARLGGSDHTLLATAEKAEDEVAEVYADALRSELPLPVRELLATQQAQVLSTRDFIRSHRETPAMK
ncbi:PA2169 family four-helix-bundle protein [Edaphobacter sp.]|uniref:PA2169 family four-helix-bundle protein n=1 Tax=Edaphobacter sp. TaxID=1934404 RepID=UPI002DBAA8CD|nr:PA2169 family four-helix-bundle protein [Edaphobacter sp.]HEU5341556.1 PA2169 family four-helix-bundle protein [Edaphobacter sp.]